MKICSHCKLNKSVECFGKLSSSPDKLRYDCNDCRKEYREKNKSSINLKLKQYYNENKSDLLQKNKLYRINNIDKINEQRKDYRNRDNVKEHIKIKNKEYLHIKKEKIKLKRIVDENFRLTEVLRSKFNRAIKRNNYSSFLGCNIEYFKKWIEYRWEPDMNWENYGECWHIDHILPINQFNFNEAIDIKICFNWTNFQPLYKKENIAKSNKIMLHHYFNNFISVFRFNSFNKQFLGYQAVSESLQWLRKTLRYGKNATYDTQLINCVETDNPQPSSLPHNDKSMEKVQRLNGIGLEEINHLL